MVTVLDNFHTGSRQNLDHWIGDPRFKLIHHDVSYPIFLEGKNPLRQYINYSWHQMTQDVVGSPAQFAYDSLFFV